RGRQRRQAPRSRPRRLARGRHRSREHPRRLHLAAATQAHRAPVSGRDRDRPRHRLPGRMSIRTRLFLAAVGAVAVAVIAMTVGFNLLLARSLSHNASDLARARATAQLAVLRPTEKGLEAGDSPDEAAGVFWVFSRRKTLRAPPAPQAVVNAARSLAGGGRRFLDVSSTDVRLYS